MKKRIIVLAILVIVFVIWTNWIRLPINLTEGNYINENFTVNKYLFNSYVVEGVIQRIITGTIIFSLICIFLSKKAKIAKQDIKPIIIGFISIVLVMEIINAVYYLHNFNTALIGLESSKSEVLDSFNQKNRLTKQDKKAIENINATTDSIAQIIKSGKTAILPEALSKILVSCIVVSVTLLVYNSPKYNDEIEDMNIY